MPSRVEKARATYLMREAIRGHQRPSEAIRGHHLVGGREGARHVQDVGRYFEELPIALLHAFHDVLHIKHGDVLAGLEGQLLPPLRDEIG